MAYRLHRNDRFIFFFFWETVAGAIWIRVGPRSISSSIPGRLVCVCVCLFVSFESVFTGAFAVASSPTFPITGRDDIKVDAGTRPATSATRHRRRGPRSLRSLRSNRPPFSPFIKPQPNGELSSGESIGPPSNRFRSSSDRRLGFLFFFEARMKNCTGAQYRREANLFGELLHSHNHRTGKVSTSFRSDSKHRRQQNTIQNTFPSDLAKPYWLLARSFSQ